MSTDNALKQKLTDLVACCERLIRNLDVLLRQELVYVSEEKALAGIDAAYTEFLKYHLVVNELTEDLLARLSRLDERLVRQILNLKERYGEAWKSEMEASVRTRKDFAGCHGSIGESHRQFTILLERLVPVVRKLQ